jgi:murein DD-endopeptidase MepM/ murein hydrolase activator NlpD
MDRRWRILVVAGVLGAAVCAPATSAAADGPTEEGVVSGHPPPEARASGGRPVFQLPFRWDQTWQAGSPHDTNGSALDFGPRRVGGNDDVVASAAGVVRRVTCAGGSYPRIDHGGGWVSSSYNIVNVNWSLVGRRVLAGTRLGDAGQATPCGGRSNFPHVHFEVSYRGAPVDLDGISMGGYTVHSSGRRYSGHWTDDGSGAVVVRNPGEARCCLRSTTRPFSFPDQGELVDVDGDGRDDVVLRRSATLFVDGVRRLTWGRNTDGVFLGDVTGDGRADVVLRRGAEYLVNTDAFQPGGDVAADRHFTWGRATDRFHLADVDGDGRDDFVIRNGTTVAVSTDSGVPGGDPTAERRTTLGRATDRLHVGDVTGDGMADFVLQRGSTYLVGGRRFTWGAAGARLHLGDVDGDGREDFVLRRGSTIAVSTDSAVDGGDPATELRFTWGQASDQLNLGDLNADGRDDLLLRRGRSFFVDNDVTAPGANRSFDLGRASDALVLQPTATP